MNEGRYNLRSNRLECFIPIQLQLASDAEFLTELGYQTDPSQSEQVGKTDLSDSSGSDIDISALIERAVKSCPLCLMVLDLWFNMLIEDRPHRLHVQITV